MWKKLKTLLNTITRVTQQIQLKFIHILFMDNVSVKIENYKNKKPKKLSRILRVMALMKSRSLHIFWNQ